MSGILRGTTPDFVIKVNTDDFVVTDVTKLEVTIWNGTRQTIYGLSDVTLDTTENALSNVSLTADQKIRVRGRNSRNSSYYIYAPTLVIVEA